MSSIKKELGQYFTVSSILQEFVYEKVKYKDSLLLEPSFGAGHLLSLFLKNNKNYPIYCYELDNTIKPIVEFNNNQKVIYGDFTKQIIQERFKTIIGNPPYLKQVSSNNLYIQFIEICYNLLEPNGELIFIVPSDFIKLTSASVLIEKMCKNGSFTDFLFPKDEKLFEKASIDVLVFRYEKGLFSKKTIVNNKEVYCNINNGIITFSDTEKMTNLILSSLFDVYVGLVSAKEEVYKVPFGNIDILNDKDQIDKYIFTTVFPTNDIIINKHLENNKKQLLERKIRKFNEKNWFEWGAPRNIKAVEENIGKDCIYIKNMTRKKEVAFIGKVQYFGGSLLCLIPKKEIDLLKIIKILNTDEFQKDYIYAGRFKIGHKQVCNIII